MSKHHPEAQFGLNNIIRIIIFILIIYFTIRFLSDKKSSATVNVDISNVQIFDKKVSDISSDISSSSPVIIDNLKDTIILGVSTVSSKINDSLNNFYRSMIEKVIDQIKTNLLK